MEKQKKASDKKTDKEFWTLGLSAGSDELVADIVADIQPNWLNCRRDSISSCRTLDPQDLPAFTIPDDDGDQLKLCLSLPAISSSYLEVVVQAWGYGCSRIADIFIRPWWARALIAGVACPVVQFAQSWLPTKKSN